MDSCETYGETTPRPSRNVYSTDYFSIVIIYSYKFHSSVTGELKIATSRCKAVRLDICKLEVECKYLYSTRCHKLVKQMLEGSHIAFEKCILPSINPCTTKSRDLLESGMGEGLKNNRHEGKL